jgi:hypothetical protein
MLPVLGTAPARMQEQLLFHQHSEAQAGSLVPGWLSNDSTHMCGLGKMGAVSHDKVQHLIGTEAGFLATNCSVGPGLSSYLLLLACTFLPYDASQGPWHVLPPCGGQSSTQVGGNGPRHCSCHTETSTQHRT